MSEYVLKIVIIGDTHVGKSSICNSIMGNEFQHNTHQTIGVDFFTTNIVHNDIKYKLHIWDTAGQERFRSITKTYYRNSAGVFCVFDVTKRQTISNLKKLATDIEDVSPGAVIVFVGNKMDMLPKTQDPRMLSEIQEIHRNIEIVNEYAAVNGHKLTTVSSKTNTNIRGMLGLMVETIYTNTIQDRIIRNNNTKGIILVNCENNVAVEKKPCCKP